MKEAPLKHKPRKKVKSAKDLWCGPFELVTLPQHALDNGRTIHKILGNYTR